MLWETCLSLCLEAISAGSLGISAIITDRNGKVISTGRNQIFDNAESINPIKNTIVSHAEVNAIAGLPEGYRGDKSIVLYTTVEPCPMCIGAIAMSPIRHVVVASRDPYAGASELTTQHKWIAGKRIRLQFENGQTERAFASLHIYSLLQRRKLPLDHQFYEMMRELYPDVLSNMIAHRDDKGLREAIDSRDLQRVLRICAE